MPASRVCVWQLLALVAFICSWARDIPVKRGQSFAVSGILASMACGLPLPYLLPGASASAVGEAGV
jgi:hypothetical protein